MLQARLWRVLGLCLVHVERLGPGRLAGGIERDLLDPCLGLAQQFLATTLERLAALVDQDRLLERYLALFEPLDDRFQLFDRALKGQARDVGVGIFGHGLLYPASRSCILTALTSRSNPASAH